jgi:hypothetical protein
MSYFLINKLVKIIHIIDFNIKQIYYKTLQIYVKEY